MATYYVRTDGSDTNAGTGPATNQAWQTITKAIGATGIAPGDTLYIAPGVYRGAFTAAFTNPANEGQRITIAGNPTASQFSGVTAGPVIITNWTSSTSASGVTFLATKDYITLQDIFFSGYVLSGPSAFGIAIQFSGTYTIARRCGFYGVMQSGDNYTTIFNMQPGQRGPTIEDCVFVGNCSILPTSNTGTAYNSQTLVRNSIFISANSASNTNQCLRIDSGGSSPVFGGANVINCRFFGNTGIKPVTTSRVSPSFPVVIQNCIFDTVSGIVSNNTGDFIESYNIFNCQTERTNVGTGTGSLTRAFVSPDYSLSRVSGWGNLPFWANHSSSASQNAGINTNSDTADFYGVTWLAPSTPTMGPIEFFSNTATGVYVPTERNASTITIAPGSTSQSIELYLGATGLTASTSGLSARYNRTRTASVSIPLVARTIAQAWTSGGFAEVDATNMPGVYRLDVPDAALAAGADDVTIVVRGASGTNGAVMTVKLSSGGLTEAQTASAVWGASPAGYNDGTTFGGVVNTTATLANDIDTQIQDVPGNVWDEQTSNHIIAGSMGARVLKTTVDNRPVVVGTSQHIHANVHAIVDSTIAADELSGALLHNGTDYISADLLTPITSAAMVRMGPYEVKADGLGASDPLDIQNGAQHGVDIQCVDGNGNGIDITSATVTAKVYNSGASLVDTYSCTATYAADGRATFTIDTTVTNTPGTYTTTITRTTGASDTQVFGPLRIYVRDI